MRSTFKSSVISNMYGEAIKAAAAREEHIIYGMATRLECKNSECTGKAGQCGYCWEHCNCGFPNRRRR